jgi:hypothetical protein
MGRSIEGALALFAWFAALDHHLTSNYLFGRGRYPWPTLGALSGHWPLDIRTRYLSALVGDDHGIVLELDPGAVNATEGSALTNDDGPEHLPAGFWIASLDTHFDHITDTG